jgi:hypothetical protein
MALGLPRIWLPRWVLGLRIGRRDVHAGVEQSRPAARWVDHLLRRRLEFLSQPPFVNVIALLVIVAALITFPLGLVPLAPIIPGFAVVLIGLGMTARDGLWLSLGVILICAALWLSRALIF